MLRRKYRCASLFAYWQNVPVQSFRDRDPNARRVARRLVRIMSRDLPLAALADDTSSEIWALASTRTAFPVGDVANPSQTGPCLGQKSLRGRRGVWRRSFESASPSLYSA